ncbi:UDP-galactopyranose mutase (plasmid) [Ensifer sp. PDNC004]|uniref:UDP-galactopyranose mutase n=1 Tax=Ensifer sp. PDNC004 TaxID=2811423 RepID=UPI0019645614|nr:UDP-galactopyranose mutase [Ensifer sp. PDNC004]QRY65484.1 UDP-galactopyranose mutase [Ensifer sp. PDNC004]
MKKHYDWLIVGAGYTGAIIAERLATQAGKTALVIDRRDHIAGNAYDRRNDAGVLYHQYGPHIFHTNSHAVADYLSAFTEWLPYEHRVLGMVDGRIIPIPFNLTSLEILFPKAEAERLAKILIEAYGIDQKVPILKMRENPVQGVRDLADFIYKNVFYGYTTKQWGLEPEQLSPSVTARVPVHISYDDRYFQDSFQNMPKEGYTKMFERILAQQGVSVSLNTDLADLGSEVSYDRLLYTGAIDEYFDYVLGELPYRSLDFNFQTYRQQRHQAVGQVNYPVSHDFTRITEMGHLTQEWSDVTTVAIEYPVAHVPGKTIPYYPIPRDENQELHNRYVALAEKDAANVLFAGRLGDYRYYNMDQAVGRALALFNKSIVA